jgi:hypothetical protein
MLNSRGDATNGSGPALGATGWQAAARCAAAARVAGCYSGRRGPGFRAPAAACTDSARGIRGRGARGRGSESVAVGVAS